MIPIAAQDTNDSPGPERWRQGEPETFLGALNSAVAEIGDEIFLDFDEGSLTYAEVDLRSNFMAHRLATIGIAKGKTVATVLDNNEDAVVVWFALSKLGAIWVPINTAYRGEFLRHQVADSLAEVLVCENHYLDDVCAALAGSDVRLVLCRGPAPAPQSGPVTVLPLGPFRGSVATPVNDPPKPEDIACLIYTSGTTGPSKGCMISHNYLCNGGRQQNICLPPQPREIIWTCLPLFHVSASSYVIIATLLARTRARVAKRFSVTGFWEDVESSGATTALIVASMFPLLARAPDSEAMLRCHGRLRAVVGIPITLEDRKTWRERFGVEYLNSFNYGQTEASKICNLPWGSPLPPLDSCGPVAEDFEIIIADTDGRSLPCGVPGEILARPNRPGVMFSGYWRRPDDTIKVWRNLWMHTGDIGRLDDHGNLYFVDRQKDYVRSRGENISSVEVETVIMNHAAVQEVAYHAVPMSDGIEEDLKATVVLIEGVVLTEGDLCRWMIERLPHFAVPRYVEFRTSLPKTPTGRIRKHELRNEGRTDTTWDAYEYGLIVRRKPHEPAVVGAKQI